MPAVFISFLLMAWEIAPFATPAVLKVARPVMTMGQPMASRKLFRHEHCSALSRVNAGVFTGRRQAHPGEPANGAPLTTIVRASGAPDSSLHGRYDLHLVQENEPSKTDVNRVETTPP